MPVVGCCCCCWYGGIMPLTPIGNVCGGGTPNCCENIWFCCSWLCMCNCSVADGGSILPLNDCIGGIPPISPAASAESICCKSDDRAIPVCCCCCDAMSCCWRKSICCCWVNAAGKPKFCCCNTPGGSPSGGCSNPTGSDTPTGGVASGVALRREYRFEVFVVCCCPCSEALSKAVTISPCSPALVLWAPALAVLSVCAGAVVNVHAAKGVSTTGTCSHPVCNRQKFFESVDLPIPVV